MSKRHRKTKDMISSQSSDDAYENMTSYDLSMYESPKGKKPKGKDKRLSHKRAYYDD